MALSPRLDLRQSQQLVLTPQLQQAIKLLQMANLELSGYIQQEVEKNPLLEAGDQEGVPEGDIEPQSDLSGFDGEAGVYSAEAGLGGDGVVSDRDSPLDADFEAAVFDDAPVDAAGGSGQLGLQAGSGSGSGSGALPADADFEGRLTEAPDLKDHLTEQMLMLLADPMERMIAAHLIDLVDEAGYLFADLSDVPERLGCTPEDVEHVLVHLKTMEPLGVFAASLGECLEAQLRERDRLDPAMAALVGNLPLLAKQDFAALKRICGVDDEDMADMVREIRTLNPKPGLAFGGEAVQPVVPDVFVRRNPAGLWTVELNSETLPKVLVNNHYYAELSTLAGSKKDKQYLSECLSSANWLVRALDQRARTILKVASEIVRQQEAFFNQGVRHLKPLTLRDVAEAISMHESTVSRVTSTKFMATDRGIFEFRYFFTSAIQSSAGGDALSSEAVRHRIRALIDAEDPRRILSDDRLVELLHGEGIDIARRTVAKYREGMRIPSSVQRRRDKRMRA